MSNFKANALTCASAIIAPELNSEGGKITTTSLQVAQHFGKRHADVMRAIRALGAEMPQDLYERNFALTTIETKITGAGNAAGGIRKDPAFRINRDGFSLLAMGFTGREALQWKLAYIAAFNKMEAELKGMDPERISIAFRLAAEAAAMVEKTVFEAVVAGDDAVWLHNRYLLSLGYDKTNKPSIPHAMALDFNDMVVSMDELPERVNGSDGCNFTDTQLAKLARACAHRIEKRAVLRSEREKAAAASSQKPTDGIKWVAA